MANSPNRFEIDSNKKKFDAGRSPEPWQVREVSSDGGLIDADVLETVLEAQASASESSRSEDQKSRSHNGIDLKSLNLSRRIENLIRNPVPVAQRSEAIMAVICALADKGLPDTVIFSIFNFFPVGEKANPEHWLRP